MRIAILAEVFLPKIDGVVNRTLHLLRQLANHGDEVMLVCPQAPGCDQCDTQVVPVPSFLFPFYPEYRIALPDQQLVERVSAFKPDVLHYLSPFAFGFRCNDLFRKSGLNLPSVFSFHTLYAEFAKRYRGLGTLSKLVWWLTREYHNRADVNLTVSTIQQEDLKQRGFERVELWPPAVDSDIFHPSRKSPAMRERLTNGKPTKRLFLTVSRLAPEKNVPFLADVLKAFPDASLAIVGDGPARGDLERHFQGLNAHFVGYLRGEELASAYASADAFVYASETETMGNVVLEAMAAGCPVVAPRAGGIPNLLTHGTSGFLYQPRDLTDAVKCTSALMTDDALHARIAAAARQEIEERNWSYAIGRVRQAYQQAIEQPEATRARPKLRDHAARVTANMLVSAFRMMANRKAATLKPSELPDQEPFAASVP